jgi:hypothetical protein
MKLPLIRHIEPAPAFARFVCQGLQSHGRAKSVEFDLLRVLVGGGVPFRRTSLESGTSFADKLVDQSGGCSDR